MTAAGTLSPNYTVHICGFGSPKDTEELKAKYDQVSDAVDDDLHYDLKTGHFYCKAVYCEHKISPIIINSHNEFMYHKTTYRPWYCDSSQKIKQNEVFDEIYFNEREELTEGARSNIILQIDGKLYTPPVKCGILNGIYRQKLLNKCEEKILYKKDLERAEKIFCVNSVRGIIEVEL